VLGCNNGDWTPSAGNGLLANMVMVVLAAACCVKAKRNCEMGDPLSVKPVKPLESTVKNMSDCMLAGKSLAVKARGVAGAAEGPKITMAGDQGPGPPALTARSSAN